MSVSGVVLALAAFTASGGEAANASPPLNGLCSHIMTRTHAAPESGFRYEYERIIFSAVGLPASAKDKTEQLQPLRDFWAANQNSFRCNSAGFGIVDGNALKYAVVSNSYHILNNAAIVWKLDLNLMSDGTGETLLDFVLGRMMTNHGNNALDQLELLITTLRAQGGAKYGCEIPGGKILWTSTDRPTHAPTERMWVSYIKICNIS